LNKKELRKYIRKWIKLTENNFDFVKFNTPMYELISEEDSYYHITVYCNLDLPTRFKMFNRIVDINPWIGLDLNLDTIPDHKVKDILKEIFTKFSVLLEDIQQKLEQYNRPIVGVI